MCSQNSTVSVVVLILLTKYGAGWGEGGGGRGCVSRVISLLTCVYPSFDMLILCVHFICPLYISRQTGSSPFST